MYSSCLSKGPVIGVGMIKELGRRPETVQKGQGKHSDTGNLNLALGWIIFKETAHVRQSNGSKVSKVSSFHVISGHLVRFSVTLYCNHSETSHLVSCYCWNEYRQWSLLSVCILWISTCFWMCYLNMQVIMSYNKMYDCSDIVNLWPLMTYLH